MLTNIIVIVILIISKSINCIEANTIHSDHSNNIVHEALNSTNQNSNHQAISDGPSHRTRDKSKSKSRVPVIDEDHNFQYHVEDGEPTFMINCPIDSLVEPKNESIIIDAEYKEHFQRIKEKIKVDWFKDGKPWLTRPNGNDVTKVDNFTYILYQIGKSDEGTYKCRLNYNAITSNYTSLFRFYRSGSVTLQIIIGLPDIQPVISHPPMNVIAKRGSDANFTCMRAVETTSHQSTYWFKSCSWKNTTCNNLFERQFELAKEISDIKPLMIFQQSMYNDNDYFGITNVSEESTGQYACALVNQKGMDLRKANLVLHEDIFIAEQAVLADQAHKWRINDWIWVTIASCSVLFVLLAIMGLMYVVKISILKEKKKKQQQTDPLIKIDSEIGVAHKSANLRQHLPNFGCPNIYNISKSSVDGVITGHFNQNNGHIMAQSVCTHRLDKEDSSMSSSNSQQSDEASGSWLKSSLCSHNDNCRALYLHTSHTTASTALMYDHPPSSGTFRHCNAMMQNSCVYNPTYGFLNPENDTSDWAFPRSRLDRLDKIGEGQFGEVWRYIARDEDGRGELVAVKRLKHQIGSGDRERMDLIAEIEIMKSVNSHDNVIKLLHYCAEGSEPILLIMEYAENGKLQSYLRDCRASNKQYGSISDRCQPSVTSKELIKFSYHIAKGMEYVASQGIVHRDLASRNILVSRDKVCKVADFGFARRVNEDCAYERTTVNPVPVKWMAPEALINNKFTTKSDVFSLGILMWEIVTLGATPYQQLSSGEVFKKVTTGGRLDRPAHCSDEFYHLMSQCWLHDSALRPTFKEVANEFEQLLLSDNDYIKLDQYPEHAYYNIIYNEEKEVVKLNT